ncbi:hypothetical protein Tco_0158395 [Tanacetum coccineum]
MAPTMTTCYAGRRTAATRGGRTGGQAGRGGGRTKSKWAELVDELQLQGLLPTIVAQVGDHISNQGINESRNDNATNDSIQEDDRNVNVGNGRNGCLYKDFVACKPKEFDGKGGAVAYIRWVEKMEAVQDISGCGDNQKVLMKGKYYPSNEIQRLETEFWSHSMIHGMVVATEPPIIQNVILKVGVLTNEAVRNGSLKRTGERRGDGGESSKDGNVKGDNKRAKTGKVFAIITNPVRKEYTGLTPKCTNCNFHHNPKTPCRACTNCNRLGHFDKDYRAGPRMVNPLNAKNPTAAHGACYECGGTDHYKAACPRLNRAAGQGENHPNQTLAIEGGQGRRNNGNPTCGREFIMGAEEARQDPNIVMGTFSLKNHYAMMLFDFGVGYSFVSTTFMPLLDIKPSSLGFIYEIEIASRQLVEINKVINGFRIPLPHGEMLRVYDERPEKKVKRLMSVKAEEPKLEDIAIV